MEKKTIISNIFLGLCVIVLIINAILTNDIRSYVQPAEKETFVQKIMYSFPKKIKSNERIINKNNAEIIIKDKNIAEKISAPVTKTSYSYWSGYYSENKSYSVQDSQNRLVYANINVKSLYKTKTDIDKLIKTKIIYDNKYEFDCITLKTTKDKSDFTQHISLMPLESQDIYFIAEIPKDFANSSDLLKFELKIGNNKYVTELK